MIKNVMHLESSATVPVKLPGQLGGSCKHDLGGFCVPVGMCSPEDKIQGTQDICEAGLECCGKRKRFKLAYTENWHVN